MFTAFDSSLGTYAVPFPPLVKHVPCARRCIWLSSTWMTRDGATLDPAYAPTVANVMATGGSLRVLKPDGWDVTLTINPSEASLLDVLDFEAWMGDPAKFQTIVDFITEFKKAQPQLKVGFYPTGWLRPPDVPVNAVDQREDLITRGTWRSRDYPTYIQAAYINRAKEYNAPLFKLLDFFAPDFYLLNPNRLDADFAFMDAFVTQFASYKRPLYPFVWGIYHESFTSPRTVLPNTVRTRLVSWLKRKADGCIVWGNESDNFELWNTIAKEVDGVDRPALLAADAASSATVRPPAR